MTREEFIKKLHPAITHIRASEEMSKETLEAINNMVEKVTKMTNEEIKVADIKIKNSGLKYSDLLHVLYMLKLEELQAQIDRLEQVKQRNPNNNYVP